MHLSLIAGVWQALASYCFLNPIADESPNMREPFLISSGPNAIRGYGHFRCGRSRFFLWLWSTILSMVRLKAPLGGIASMA